MFDDRRSETIKLCAIEQKLDRLLFLVMKYNKQNRLEEDTQDVRDRQTTNAKRYRGAEKDE